MPNIKIVTDSCAQFLPAHLAQRSSITVLPNRIRIAGRVYREGIDLSAEEALHLIAADGATPQILSPDPADFMQVYRDLADDCDAILSIHPSRHLYRSWGHAVTASEQFGGHCEIAVIDSQTLSAGLGMLVQLAITAADTLPDAEAVVRYVRGAVERIYSIFYVESVNPLSQNKLMSPSHSFLGAMLGVKPFLSVENGMLMPIEKVRTRMQAVERLVEFVVEFTDIADVIILQNRSHISEQTRMIQDRLTIEFPGRHFPYTMYGPSLAALLGTEATGIVILESEMDYVEDDFDED